MPLAVSWWFRSLLAALALAVAATPAAGARLGVAWLPNEIAFSDRLHGVASFAVGPTCGTAVATTGDGGRSWRLRRAGGCPRFTALATRGSRAWSVRRNGLWWSVDRGRSWRRSSRLRFAQLSFASGTSGWAVTDTKGWPRLFVTEDGGRSWTRRRAVCDDSLYAFAARVTVSRGWMLCLDLPGAGQQIKRLYVTRDGGRTWRRRGQLGSGGYGAGIVFRPSGRGWLWEHRGGLVRTDDGGRRWRDLPIAREETYEARSVSFVDDDVGYALFDARTTRSFQVDLRLTRDGGDSWQLVRSWSRS